MENRERKLALHGGTKVKTVPFGKGKRFGLEEAKELLEALEQNTLFYHGGKKVKQFLSDFNELYGVRYSVAVSSGTAAIHVALGAAGISVGDEVITSPITDQGTIVGILYQNAIPVFADLDPHTYNLDPKSVEARITDKTKAIVAVHLAGNPCDMDAIMDIARRHGLKVIEDCAQSYLTRYKGRLAGTIGDYGCFSTNDFKHMSTGDGGIVTVNSGSEADYYVAHAFADKNYQRFGDAVSRDLTYLAPNYRMTELQGAVGIAQLKKLPWICEQRHRYGDRLTEGIRDLPGIKPHRVTEDDWSSYWFYMLRVDEAKLGCTRDEFSKALAAEGIPNSAGYIPKVVYMQPLFQNKQAYLNSHFPFELSEASYAQGICPEAEAILETAVRLPVNEFYTGQDVEETIEAIRKVAAYYAR
ncbi:GDP-perosamine synthase [Paenibacillus solanacearum]|uniref:GDP-perosamine synthase n=1 Tax=Paenibacillus solanacearum TaxID=2048548 RepID=A0A916JT62_9BACL|nr:DegT/DnrJ/EryC1/StrS family aminotransferase [Paenibacillus solanacearum]CAG7595484.1 GDP-perosamine synthase [Paenibacillus solanacearum]